MENREHISCFGNAELTVIGNVFCGRGSADFIVDGASFIDGSRICMLDGEFSLHGRALTSLLEVPDPVETFTGRMLVRGHFDDPGAQQCFAIPFGMTATGQPQSPPEPAAVQSCRQMFVVSTVTELD